MTKTTTPPTAASRTAARRLLVALALLAIPTLLIGPALLPGKAFLPADLLVQFEPWRSHISPLPEAHWDALVWDGIAQYYPWRAFAAESLRAGHIPLWNPYQFCGTPFLANGQSAVLYPLNLLFWVLPVPTAFGWSAGLHLLLTGWFAYLFLRRAAGIGRVGAVAGALVWQGNGFTVAWLHLPTTLCTIAWLPLVLLLCDRALLTGRMRYALLAGVALGLAYLGGHPQMFLFVGLLTAAYVVARGVSRAVQAPLLARVVRLVSTGAIVSAIGLGLAAAQLLPTLDFLHLAHRAFTPGPESYAFYLKRALQPLQVGGLLLPHPLGNPATGTYIGPENYAEYTLYIGLLALVLAVWAAVASRTWHTRFLAATGVVTLLIALGTGLNWPLYHWVPGIANTGSPARFLILYVFAASLLAGVGVEVVSRGVGDQRPRLLKRALTLAFILFGLMIVRMAGGVAPVGQTPGGTLAESVVWIAACALLPIVVLSGRRAVFAVGLTTVLALDLLFAGHSHVHAVPQPWVYSQAANPGPVAGRVMTNAENWGPGRFPNAVLPPNGATVYHLRDVSGYDSLYFAHYRDFAALLQGGEPSPPFNGNMLLPRLTRIPNRGLLALAGVDRMLSSVPLPGLPPAREGAYSVYDGLGGWPRARVLQSAVFCADTAQTRDVFARLGALPDLAIITGPDEPAPRFAPGVRPTAELKDVSPNEVVVDLPRGGGGYLLLADTYAPGWHAYGDGQALPIRLAYLAFRAVPLPQQVHRVTFRYEPGSFRVGLFIGLVTLAALCAAAGLFLTREAPRVR